MVIIIITVIFIVERLKNKLCRFNWLNCSEVRLSILALGELPLPLIGTKSIYLTC